MNALGIDGQRDHDGAAVGRSPPATCTSTVPVRPLSMIAGAAPAIAAGVRTVVPGLIERRQHPAIRADDSRAASRPSGGAKRSSRCRSAPPDSRGHRARGRRRWSRGHDSGRATTASAASGCIRSGTSPARNETSTTGTIHSSAALAKVSSVAAAAAAGGGAGDCIERRWRCHGWHGGVGSGGTCASARRRLLARRSCGGAGRHRSRRCYVTRKLRSAKHPRLDCGIVVATGRRRAGAAVTGAASIGDAITGDAAGGRPCCIGSITVASSACGPATRPAIDRLGAVSTSCTMNGPTST